MRNTIYCKKRESLLAVRAVLNLHQVKEIPLPTHVDHPDQGRYYKIEYDDYAQPHEDRYFKLDDRTRLIHQRGPLLASRSSTIIEKQKKVIMLFRDYLTGMSYSNVAHKHIMSVGIVNKRIHDMVIKLVHHVPPLADAASFRQVRVQGTSEELREHKFFWLTVLDALEKHLNATEEGKVAIRPLTEDDSVYGLVLTTRARKILAMHRVMTIKDLIAFTRELDRFKVMKSCGRQTWNEYLQQLALHRFIET